MEWDILLASSDQAVLPPGHLPTSSLLSEGQTEQWRKPHTVQALSSLSQNCGL